MTYNQDAHTASTIKQVMRLINLGRPSDALRTLERAKARCKEKAGLDAAKALVNDVMFTVRASR